MADTILDAVREAINEGVTYITVQQGENELLLMRHEEAFGIVSYNGEDFVVAIKTGESSGGQFVSPSLTDVILHIMAWDHP